MEYKLKIRTRYYDFWTETWSKFRRFRVEFYYSLEALNYAIRLYKESPFHLQDDVCTEISVNDSKFVNLYAWR